MSKPEPFLRRWSRLKRQSANPAPLSSNTGAAPVPQDGALDFGADFSRFMHKDVDEATRSAALRELFMTDHYRVMDGLDVYVEDYSRPALLTSAMLATLDHARHLLPAEEQPATPAAIDQRPEQA